MDMDPVEGRYLLSGAADATVAVYDTFQSQELLTCEEEENDYHVCVCVYVCRYRRRKPRLEALPFFHCREQRRGNYRESSQYFSSGEVQGTEGGPALVETRGEGDPAVYLTATCS